jgi:hypothetical protein
VTGSIVTMFTPGRSWQSSLCAGAVLKSGKSKLQRSQLVFVQIGFVSLNMATPVI